MREMKKIIVFLIVVFLAATAAVSDGYSQTYYYRAIMNIDENGFRSRASGGMWITFVDNKRIVHQSDQFGNRRRSFNFDNDSNFSFRTIIHESSNENRTFVYQMVERDSVSGMDVFIRDSFIYFNSDFSRMQTIIRNGDEYNRIEFERSVSAF